MLQECFMECKIEMNYLDNLHKLFFQKEEGKKVKAEANKEKQM